MSVLEAAAWLDKLEPREARVGYGGLGVQGALGYDGRGVVVQGTGHEHALSAHGPARIAYALDGAASAFRAAVAINDDVLGQRTHAHFLVRADGRLVAQEGYVRPGDAPRALAADVSGARTLELIVLTTCWEYCHAVWLDPRLDAAPAPRIATRVDALARTEIAIPETLPRARRCVAATASPGFSDHVDDLLGSVVANGCCPDALLAVFAVAPDDECRRVAAKYEAVLVPCTPRARVNSTVKALLYSAAYAIDADEFVCLDGDMLVLDDLRPLFGALSAHRPGTILACREGSAWYADVNHALCTVYAGRPGDLQRICGSSAAAGYPLVVNDGTFAAGREALLALDGEVRGWGDAPAWVDERPEIYWRNQLVFNLALARLDCGAELDPGYNVQLNNADVDFDWTDGRVTARRQGRPVHVLHFNGNGRWKYPEWRGWHRRVAAPLTGRGSDDGFGAFERALRSWVGRHGMPALAWTFYGTADAEAARVRDPVALPLFRAVHALVRANGCVRAIETGTARGVSAALLAAAVGHRPGARVVTFDVEAFPEREELWAALGPRLRAVIEPRDGDAVAGLRAAVDAHERYEVALLDSLHREEHVWAEFELAVRLVCEGGLILVHDSELENETVGAALRRVERAGYGVTRLWTARAGVAEDDGLGLAVIENRRRVAA